MEVAQTVWLAFGVCVQRGRSTTFENSVSKGVIAGNRLWISLRGLMGHAGRTNEELGWCAKKTSIRCMIRSFEDDRAGWRGDLEDPVLVAIKEVNHITYANVVSSPITCRQGSR